MNNKNFDKKYAELSALIDNFIATISATPLPDFSGMPEQEIRSQWHEFKKTCLCVFLNDIKRDFADYIIFLEDTVPIQREFEERTSTSSNRFSSPVSC